MRHPHVVGIDVLRFFAACIVVAFHLGFFYLLSTGSYPLATLHISGISQYTSSLTRYGFVGVEIFFVISGYVISFSIEGRSRVQYVRSRFLRLWPTVWVCATICLVLAILTHQESASVLVPLWVRSMIIVPRGPWIDGVYWTLPIEIAFYIVVLFVGNDVARGRALALIMGTSSICFWACYAVFKTLPQFQHYDGIIDYAATSRVLDLLLIHHGLYFALGFLIHNRPKSKIMVPFCLLTFCAAFIEISAQSGRLSGVVGVFIAPWYAYAIWIACMIYLAAAVRCNSAWIAALGQHRVKFLRAVGALTYPLYLVHVIVAWATAYGLIRLGVPTVFAWAAGPVVAIACAVIVANLAEPRVRQLTVCAMDYLSHRYSGPNVGAPQHERQILS